MILQTSTLETFRLRVEDCNGILYEGEQVYLELSLGKKNLKKKTNPKI